MAALIGSENHHCLFLSRDRSPRVPLGGRCGPGNKALRPQCGIVFSPALTIMAIEVVYSVAKAPGEYSGGPMRGIFNPYHRSCVGGGHYNRAYLGIGKWSHPSVVG
jgi:hypothetical protein